MKVRIERHKDDTIKAKGHMKVGELEGYWEWFRNDGTKMRSGYFGKANRSANGRLMTAREKSTKSRR
jgi:hypothetical protein